MALSCSPRLIIADEPTTALDVTIQAQILDLLRDLKDKINASIMLITHFLSDRSLCYLDYNGFFRLQSVLVVLVINA